MSSFFYANHLLSECFSYILTDVIDEESFDTWAAWSADASNEIWRDDSVDGNDGVYTQDDLVVIVGDRVKVVIKVP